MDTFDEVYEIPQPVKPKKSPLVPDPDDEIHSPPLVEVDEHLEPSELQKALSLEAELQSPVFLAILVFVFLGAIAFILNIFFNVEVVNIESEFGNGIPASWFFIIIVILGILTAHMVYKPYIIDRSNGGSIVLYALVFYIIIQIVWSTALFNSRTRRGTATLTSVFLLATTVWLGWVCYHFVPDSIWIFLLLLFWCFYLQDYTYNVSAHPWTRSSLTSPPS